MELLVTISIIAILSGMILPALAKGKQSANKIVCSNNLRQLTVSSLIYAEDDSAQSLSGRTGADDQSLNYLHPYVKSKKVFVCPQTRNMVRNSQGNNPVSGEQGLTDLFKFAGSPNSAGMSYMVNAFIGHGTPYTMDIPFRGGSRRLPYLRKTLNNIQNYRKYHDAFGSKDSVAGPAGHWLALDHCWSENPAYPDPGDNHGTKGGNVSFCDGHIEWIAQKNYIYRYELDADENRTKIALTY